MEYLFGLVFTLLKIALQAAAYASLLRWLVIWFVNKKLSINSLRFTGNRRQLWRRSFIVAYASLLLFSWTYWGNHGLGDSARLPIGHGEAIEEINNVAAYFEASKPIKLPTDIPVVSRFRVAGNLLCGQAGDNSYFTYDLVTKRQQLFADTHSYNAYTRQHSLPNADELQPFDDAYDQYWGGWRFWLLA